MRRLRRFSTVGRARPLSLALMLVGLTVSGGAVSAQSTYPPPPVVPECHITTVVGGPSTAGEDDILPVPLGGAIRVQGEAGCVTPGSTVEVWAQSHLILIHPGFLANADGSYRSPVITLPLHLDVGLHNIIPTFVADNQRFFCPIRIFGGGGGGGLVDPTGGGAVANPTRGGGGGGLGNTNGGGGGILPKTGAGLLMLVLWAIALIAVGTALALAARRRIARLQPVRLVGSRWRSRSNGPAALPPPDVPFMDTTGFVPTRPAGRAPSSSVTEADLVPEVRAWED